MFEHRFGEFDQVPCDCADRERCCPSVRVSASSGAGNKRVFDDENGRNGAKNEGFSSARSLRMFKDVVIFTTPRQHATDDGYPNIDLTIFAAQSDIISPKAALACIYYEGTLLEPSLVSVLSISYAICDFFAGGSDFLKEIRRRRSGRRRFSSLSFWFRLFMLRRLLWCGGRHRVSSNHLYKRWRAESAEREIRLHFLRAYTSLRAGSVHYLGVFCFVGCWPLCTKLG